jgi:hypothetical protein
MNILQLTIRWTTTFGRSMRAKKINAPRHPCGMHEIPVACVRRYAHASAGPVAMAVTAMIDAPMATDSNM